MAEKHVDKVIINYECIVCGKSTEAEITESDVKWAAKQDSPKDAFGLLCSGADQLITNPHLFYLIAGALGVGAVEFGKGVVKEAGSQSFRELLNRFKGSNDEVECNNCDSFLDIDIDLGSILTINIGSVDEDDDD
jgi:hypothetical protein